MKAVEAMGTVRTSYGPQSFQLGGKDDGALVREIPRQAILEASPKRHPRIILKHV